MKQKQIQTVNPISHNENGYPEIICPDCNRHFYWRKEDKEFYCICGAVIMVEKNH